MWGEMLVEGVPYCKVWVYLQISSVAYHPLLKVSGAMLKF